VLTTVSCPAPYGVGGLGRHLAQIVEELRAADELRAYYCSQPAEGDDLGVRVDPALSRFATRYTPIRVSPGQRWLLTSEIFDRDTARRALRSERYIGFSGQALRTITACRPSTVELVSPTAHVLLLAERFAQAFRVYPIEGSWLNGFAMRKVLAEYERADVIHVASEYVRASFLTFGVPEQKLRLVDLHLPAHFTPAPRRADDGVFRVLYIGALTVTKGVPVLLDAVSRVPGRLELILLGGWGTRGMRRFLERRMRLDDRIRVAAGDALEYLWRADVLVHPSYSDGFGYAPAEAVACGVPVIVTEDTGMREHLVQGHDGWVVQTGDAEAIASLIEALRDAKAGRGGVSQRFNSAVRELRRRPPLAQRHDGSL
jgi:glycosyltransferase involved in cell wall biosynthesis